jgi:predicted lipase
VQRLQGVYPTAQIRVTGHSLGAAVAQLTGMRLVRAGINVDNMINFGMPRVGDKEYAEFSNKTWPNQWRMTHNADIIPHVPPRDWPFSYHHTIREVYEDKHGNYTICDESGEDKHCNDSHTLYTITDHLRYMDQCMGDFCGNCH